MNRAVVVVDAEGQPQVLTTAAALSGAVAALAARAEATGPYTIDSKLLDLARIGYRNDDGSKLFGGRRRHSPESRATKAEIRASRKAERNRKRDQRRKSRR